MSFFALSPDVGLYSFPLRTLPCVFKLSTQPCMRESALEAGSRSSSCDETGCSETSGFVASSSRLTLTAPERPPHLMLRSEWDSEDEVYHHLVGSYKDGASLSLRHKVLHSPSRQSLSPKALGKRRRTDPFDRDGEARPSCGANSKRARIHPILRQPTDIRPTLGPLDPPTVFIPAPRCSPVGGLAGSSFNDGYDACSEGTISRRTSLSPELSQRFLPSSRTRHSKSGSWSRVPPRRRRMSLRTSDTPSLTDASTRSETSDESSASHAVPFDPRRLRPPSWRLRPLMHPNHHGAAKLSSAQSLRNRRRQRPSRRPRDVAPASRQPSPDTAISVPVQSFPRPPLPLGTAEARAIISPSTIVFFDHALRASAYAVAPDIYSYTETFVTSRPCPDAGEMDLASLFEATR